MLTNRQKEMDRLKAITNMDEESMLDVVDEATLHLIEYFKAQEGKRFRRDYCFIMGKVYRGTNKTDPGEEVNTNCIFMDGDLHEFSHDLAALMAMNPNVYRYVFHAIEMYTRMR